MTSASNCASLGADAGTLERKGDPVTTFLETAAELQWLREVHLKSCKRLPPFAVAALEGNEDAPDSITLYEVNHVNSLTLRLVPDPEGEFHNDTERW